MSAKDRVKAEAKAQGRNLSWIGQQVGIADRRSFDSRLRYNSLTTDQQNRIAAILGVPVAELFPEGEKSAEVV